MTSHFLVFIFIWCVFHVHALQLQFLTKQLHHLRVNQDLAPSSMEIHQRKPQLSFKDTRMPLFASRSPSTTGGSGGTALDTRVEQKTSTKIRDEIEKNWRLILHDDTVHTIQQVCDIVSSSCPLCPGARAYEVTMEVHMTGAGTVCVANKKIVTEYTKILQSKGLTVSMAPDEDFESGGDV